MILQALQSLSQPYSRWKGWLYSRYVSFSLFLLLSLQIMQDGLQFLYLTLKVFLQLSFLCFSLTSMIDLALAQDDSKAPISTRVHSMS